MWLRDVSSREGVSVCTALLRWPATGKPSISAAQLRAPATSVCMAGWAAAAAAVRSSPASRRRRRARWKAECGAPSHCSSSGRRRRWPGAPRRPRPSTSRSWKLNSGFRPCTRCDIAATDDRRAVVGDHLLVVHAPVEAGEVGRALRHASEPAPLTPGVEDADLDVRMLVDACQHPRRATPGWSCRAAWCSGRRTGCAPSRPDRQRQ